MTREEKAAYKRRYRAENYEKILAYNRAYGRENREKTAAWNRKYRDCSQSPELRSKINKSAAIKSRKYYADNREKCLAIMREKYAKDPKKFIAKSNEYTRRRLKTNPNFRLQRICQCRLWWALKNNVKAGRTFELIGCTSDQLREYLQSLFVEGMTFDNHGRGEGKWHIDHIIPFDAVDMSQESEQRRVCHYTNLRPMWGIDNIRKGARLDYPAVCSR